MTRLQLAACLTMGLACACATQPPPQPEPPRKHGEWDSTGRYVGPGASEQDWTADGRYIGPDLQQQRSIAAQRKHEAEVEAAGPQYVMRTECPQCRDKEAKHVVAKAEYEAAKERQKMDCKPAQRTTVGIQDGRAVETAPDLEWVCNGKTVTSKTSASLLQLETTEGYLRLWIKKNCGEEVLKEHKSVGEKYCRD